MFEREYREMSFVPRWTIVRTIQKQNVAEHTFYVTLYAGQIADLIEWLGDRAALLDAALRHDLEETYMSDIPGPSKRAMLDDKHRFDRMTYNYNCDQFGDDYAMRNRACVHADVRWNDEIKTIIKVADLLDECFFLATDIQLGNKSLFNVVVHSQIRLEAAIAKLPITDLGTQLDLVSLFREHVKRHRSMDSRVPTVPVTA